MQSSLKSPDGLLETGPPGETSSCYRCSSAVRRRSDGDRSDGPLHQMKGAWVAEAVRLAGLRGIDQAGALREVIVAQTDNLRGHCAI
jgi:hypothetical protein